jgi:hypothetical protein
VGDRTRPEDRSARLGELADLLVAHAEAEEERSSRPRSGRQPRTPRRSPTARRSTPRVTRRCSRSSRRATSTPRNLREELGRAFLRRRNELLERHPGDVDTVEQLVSAAQECGLLEG